MKCDICKRMVENVWKSSGTRQMLCEPCLTKLIRRREEDDDSSTVLRVSE